MTIDAALPIDEFASRGPATSTDFHVPWGAREFVGDPSKGSAGGCAWRVPKRNGALLQMRVTVPNALLYKLYVCGPLSEAESFRQFSQCINPTSCG